MSLPAAVEARFWCLAFLCLGPPVCVALALIGSPGAASHALAADPFLPGGLGLRIGEALGLEPGSVARLGRLADVAAFAALGVSALALAARGRAALFALLCLPASLAAALGPDGPLLALGALAAALLTPRPLTGRRRWPRLAGAALAISLIALARPACAPAAGMLLVPFPPAGRIGRFCRDRLALAVLTGMVLPGAALWAARTAPVAGVPFPPGPSLPASLPPLLPWPLYGLWAVALLVPLVALRRGPLPPPAERIWLAGSVLLGLWLMVLAGTGAGRRDGPQARDLLPLLPILVPAFARGRIGTAASLRWPALLPVLAAAVDVVALPLLALRA